MTIKEKLNETWRAACRHDGIPEDTKFAIFSDDNPFAKEHNKWAMMWLAGRKLLRETI